jgi:hypothetical protein
MHSANDELIATITKQLEDLRQINQVLTAPNFQDYLTRYAQFKQYFLGRGYRRDSRPWNLLLDNFDFVLDLRDLRTQALHRALSATAQIDKQSSLNLHDLLHITFHNIHTHKNTDFFQCNAVQSLISEQITILEQRLVPATPHQAGLTHSDVRNHQPSHGTQSQEIIVHASWQLLTRHKMIAGSGAGLMGTSLLLHLAPSFALIVGIHLSPAMFVVLFVLGACLFGYGISRKEQPTTPPPTNSNTSNGYASLYGVQIEKFLKFFFNFRQQEGAATHSPVSSANPDSNSPEYR